jgi:hypothetical protein
MKICGKLLSMLGLLLITRISRSLSTKLMVKVKGEAVPIRLFRDVLTLTSFHSIAYIECGQYDGATALKTWFDNKCVPL